MKLLVNNVTACDEVWVVSQGAGQNLRSLGYEGETVVMPNGVDLSRGRASDEAVRALNEKWDLNTDAPVYLFLGRIMWYKGLRIILDALARLRESGADFRMVFVGDGMDRAEVEAYAGTLGLTDRVFFADPIHDRKRIRAWYCRADLFLFPSTFDTNGLVVREAAACSLASVLIAGSCAAEDVIDGVSGFLIEENAESMTARLIELCKTPELVREVGAGAERELYLSWTDAVANACRRYETVIDNYRRGLYSAHEGLSDEFIHNIAMSMDGYNRAVARRRELLRELQQGYEELRQELRTAQNRRLEEFQNGQARLTEEFHAREQLLRARFNELSRYWVRFM